jgi:hypothetical protein
MSKGEKHPELHHWNCRNPSGHRAQPPKNKSGGGYPHRQEFDANLRIKGKGKRHE